MIYNDEFMKLTVGDQLEYYGSKFTIERVETDGCGRVATIWFEKGISLDLISNKTAWSIVKVAPPPASTPAIQLSLFDLGVPDD